MLQCLCNRLVAFQSVGHCTAEISSVAKAYQPKDVAVIAISSNSTVTHPQDGPDEMAKDATTQGEVPREGLNL